MKYIITQTGSSDFTNLELDLTDNELETAKKVLGALNEQRKKKRLDTDMFFIEDKTSRRAVL